MPLFTLQQNCLKIHLDAVAIELIKCPTTYVPKKVDLSLMATTGGALAKRTQYDRVDVHPRALEPGSRHHIWRCSHDDAHPDNSTLHTGAVRPHTGFVGSLFFISPRTGHGSSQVFEIAASFFVYFVSVYFSCGG